MLKFLKKKKTEEVVIQDHKGFDERTLGKKVETTFKFPHYEQPTGSPTVTSDNGFIGLQRSPKTGLDWGFDAAQLGFFAASSYFIGYQACAMIATNWLVDKACSIPSRDAIRNGYLINCGSEEIAKRLNKTDKKYKVTKHLSEMINFGRVYGGRIVLFEIESANPKAFYENPFNIDSVKPGTYKGMVQIDPNWIEPVLNESNLNNPASESFYEPEFWRIKDRLYHKSHLHIFVPYPVPDFLKPNYRYLGIPVPQRILDRAYQAERSANEALQLLITKRLVTLNVNDSALANKEQLEANTANWAAFRDNYGVLITGAGESVQQHETALGDVDTVVMTDYQLCASAANVPATKLLSTQPKGFNATGEYEEAVYREDLESIQTNDLSPLLERHYRLAAISEEIPIEEDISIQWNPLDSPTAKEFAEIENIKAQRDSALFNTGAIDAEDIRNRIKNDREGDYHNIEEGVLNGETANEQEGAMGGAEENAILQGESLGLPFTSTGEV